MSEAIIAGSCVNPDVCGWLRLTVLCANVGSVKLPWRCWLGLYSCMRWVVEDSQYWWLRPFTIKKSYKVFEVAIELFKHAIISTAHRTSCGNFRGVRISHGGSCWLVSVTSDGSLLLPGTDRRWNLFVSAGLELLMREAIQCRYWVVVWSLPDDVD